MCEFQCFLLRRKKNKQMSIILILAQRFHVKNAKQYHCLWIVCLIDYQSDCVMCKQLKHKFLKSYYNNIRDHNQIKIFAWNKMWGFAKLKKTVCSTNYDVNCETQNPSKGLFNQFSNELNIKRLMITSS